MPLGPKIMQLGLGLKNLTIPSFLIKILTGHTLYMVMSMKSFLMTCQNHEAVTTTTTMDANLNHCLATGKSLTGCLHFVYKTPVDWYSKKQATVETATYGSEFVAAKTATATSRNKPQWRQPLMVQSLLLPKQQQNRSWILGRHRGILVHPSLPSPSYLVTIDL